MIRIKTVISIKIYDIIAVMNNLNKNNNYVSIYCQYHYHKNNK